MAIQEELHLIGRELGPYVRFLITDMIFIALAIVSIKMMVLLIRLAFQERATFVVELMETISGIGIFFIFLVHSAASIIKLAKRDLVKHKKGKR